MTEPDPDVSRNEVYDAALDFLDVLYRLDFEDYHLVPDLRGGWQIEWHNRSCVLEICFPPDYPESDATVGFRKRS